MTLTLEWGHDEHLTTNKEGENKLQNFPTIFHKDSGKLSLNLGRQFASSILNIIQNSGLQISNKSYSHFMKDNSCIHFPIH